MSYILYINGKKIDLKPSSPIALTRQVNDLANIANRQSNLSQRFIAPPTADNIRNLEFVNLNGNQSNIPYQKNEAMLFDSETGICIINKGWANISQTSSNGYEINIYDGIIDFYKAIENKKLTDLNLTELNHIKNVANVTASFSGNLPYMYIIADYNGKTITGSYINIDYQQPSARLSYLWNKVMTYSGFTFEGSVFATDKFTNLFMTFAKTVSTTTPVISTITTQTIQCTFTGNYYDNWVGDYVNFPIPIYSHKFFPNAFTSAKLSRKNDNELNVLQDGTYQFLWSFSGAISYWVYTGPTLQTGVVRSQKIESNYSTLFFEAKAGDTIYIDADVPVYQGTIGGAPIPYSATENITIKSQDGYIANYNDTLIDFSLKDFVTEVMQRFGLTMIKDKNRNHLKFLTLKELISNINVLDWSDKFSKKTLEKYTIGSYAQKNKMRYRYNVENSEYKDGYFLVADENLKDELTIIDSKIYAPEKEKVNLFGSDFNTYPFWTKEVKDDGTVTYKEKQGQFYLLRSKTVNSSLALKSDKLGTTGNASSYQREDYDRLSMQEIIYNYYTPLDLILDKAKVFEAEFYLTTLDIANFNFEELIYVSQLSSYFLVNKIINFIPNKLTRCEIIKIDYQKQSSYVAPNPPYITITGFKKIGANLEITFISNIASSSAPEVLVQFGWIIGSVVAWDNIQTFSATLAGNILTIAIPTTTEFISYRINIRKDGLTSNYITKTQIDASVNYTLNIIGTI
jgi:hypothetical protein